MTKYYILPAYVGSNSFNVFQRGRLNRLGHPYCVAVCLSYEEAIHWTGLESRESKEAL